MDRACQSSPRGFLIALTAVTAMLAAASVGAGDRRAYGDAGWGRGWHGHHHHHGIHARGHGSDFAFGLSLALPLFHYRRYEREPVYVSPPRRVVVYERAPQVVVYRQPSSLAVYPAQRVRGAAPPGCREFNTEVIIAGRREAAWGIACPQSDGSWRVID